MLARSGSVSSLIFLALPLIAAAQSEPAQTDAATFTLGEIIVTGQRTDELDIASEEVGAEAIRVFTRTTLDDAAALIPGVTSSSTGGSRNERLLFVRGFDRLQVPLSIDGIRVYLPADNRLDYGRFLTPDIAAIQVAKGYPSVLDGPGALGGAVNLVTRKPDQAFEAEARGLAQFDRRLDLAAHSVFTLVGTRQDRWYAQASYARNERDFFTLSDDFVPTANEDGGRRELSNTEDWRVNAKIGFTPNATDEYALSYTRQEGSKNAPIETTVPLPVNRFWSWPYWNVDSLYFLSTTALGDGATLRTRLYRNTFDNLLRAFDDRGQTRQSLPRAFNSFYEDAAYGGMLRLDYDTSEANTVRSALHYRRDAHVEFQQLFPSGATEPRQTSIEDIWSLAVENETALTPDLDMRVGTSYDWRDLKSAEDFGGVPETSSATFIRYPIRDGDAWNAQGRLDWRPQPGLGLHASISSRTRFPTLFERFSSRFGGATSAPGLREERATQTEFGASWVRGGVRFEVAGFYAHLSDAIFAFPTLFYPCTGSIDPRVTPIPDCTPQAATQSRNLGEGDYHGADLSGSARIGPSLSIGGNYAWIERDLRDPANPEFRPVGVPTHKAFLYAEWSPAQRLSVVPALELASDRWLVNTIGTRYFRGGSYALASLRVEYELSERFSIAAGGRNLLDANYELADGFPEEGRNLFLDLRARY